MIEARPPREIGTSVSVTPPTNPGGPANRTAQSARGLEIGRTREAPDRPAWTTVPRVRGKAAREAREARGDPKATHPVPGAITVGGGAGTVARPSPK